MATLQTIRSKGPLLLIIIGLAMLAFILGDAWKIIRPNQGIQYVGTIAGEDITAMDFQDELQVYTDVVKFANQIQDLTEEDQNSLKDEVWATMVRNRILEKEAKALLTLTCLRISLLSTVRLTLRPFQLRSTSTTEACTTTGSSLRRTSRVTCFTQSIQLLSTALSSATPLPLRMHSTTAS